MPNSTQAISAPDLAQSPSQKAASALLHKLQLTNPTFQMSSAFFVGFMLLTISNPSLLSEWVNQGFSFATHYFGAFWQVLLLANFVIGLYLAFGRTGSVRLGGIDAPEITTFKWISIILCTLLAGGGVFWAAAEPIAHYVTAPPLFGGASPAETAINALSQSFLHWGFLAWAILGCLSTIVLMHLHYDKGLPLQPRTLLYPIFGQRVITGRLGNVVDTACIIAVAAGTIGPIGFLGLQISYALNALFGLPDSFVTQSLVILFAMAMYTFSALSGVSKGIQIISRYNILLSVFLIGFILLFGPTSFIVDGYVQGVGSMVDNFVVMALYRADTEWLSWWTVFFWGWFIGYGPMMAIFITRISRGRTIRQLVMSVSIVAPLVTCFWFTAIGGSGLAFEIANPGVISTAFEGFNLPAVLLAITSQLPFSTPIALLFLLLTTTFIVTTGDSMTYTISMVISGDKEPNAVIRAFWGITMGLVAIVLISMGEGGIGALQSFIVVTAVPVSLILLPTLWFGYQYAQTMASKQGIN
ncbi:BCCT family transporter [Vibrio astriarenae]|uniref:BCCT family transporter n=1 Tax=Vibrio astriarenae TaxID=1481923 RepID=UPI0037362DF9